jgi:hypothetical protein
VICSTRTFVSLVAGEREVAGAETKIGRQCVQYGKKKKKKNSRLEAALIVRGSPWVDRCWEVISGGLFCSVTTVGRVFFSVP